MALLGISLNYFYIAMIMKIYPFTSNEDQIHKGRQDADSTITNPVKVKLESVLKGRTIFISL